MSSISMLQKAGTTFLPSSLANRNQLPVSTNGERYSSRNTKTSSPAGGDVSTDEVPNGIRRRLSSLSLNKLQDSISSSIPKGSFNSMRSKSSQGLENAGSSIRKWWDLGWSWILSRKPAFAQDLEMNDEETSFLGPHKKGSWLHLFYKVRSEFDKILSFRSSSNLTLPQTFKYDHINNGVKNKKSSSMTSIPFPSGGGR
ncbi:Protein downstream neighbor of son like [Heracleum sosnowskyi]|uniref:Protein downstream neighbor of son like n=1 Tax=Heracleum sosnowskyi TaxID=360622 RepID=A0AAD8I1Z3_9APIA|nr:Protein downstream neighbor of son like [Heracleum sosnowskyi]